MPIVVVIVDSAVLGLFGLVPETLAVRAHHDHVVARKGRAAPGRILRSGRHVAERNPRFGIEHVGVGSVVIRKIHHARVDIHRHDDAVSRIESSPFGVGDGRVGEVSEHVGIVFIPARGKNDTVFGADVDGLSFHGGHDAVHDARVAVLQKLHGGRFVPNLDMVGTLGNVLLNQTVKTTVTARRLHNRQTDCRGSRVLRIFRVVAFVRIFGTEKLQIVHLLFRLGNKGLVDFVARIRAFPRINWK